MLLGLWVGQVAGISVATVWGNHSALGLALGLRHDVRDGLLAEPLVLLLEP